MAGIFPQLTDPRFIQDCFDARVNFPGYDSYEYRLWQAGLQRGYSESIIKPVKKVDEEHF